jgi:cytoskeletal protein CcmA (bactofilin family)
MPSTYTLNNGIELIGTGEQSGTWGDTTNTNLGLLDAALDGQVTVALASAGSSGSPNSLPITDGTASNGRNRMVVFSDSGDLGATAYVQLTPNDAEKIIYIRNSLSGSRSVILFQGTYNASNDYEVPAGTTAVVYFDGAGAGAVAANVFNNAYFDGLRLGSVSVTAILDEDNMASDSAAALATQQSIKAYVDSQVGTVDTLAEILAIGNTTGATDIAVDSAQKVQFRDAAIYINSSVDGQLDIVADTEIQIAATTVDLNGNLDVSGTLGVTGVLTATSLDISGDIDVDGTTNLDVVDIDGAVDMASTLLVTGVLTTTAATVSNGGGQFNGAINVGVDDTGYDVKFFGATAGAYMLWDESADDLILGGAAGLSVNSAALVTGVLTTTAATVFNGGFAANQESTIIAVDGAADNAFALIVKNQEATDGRSQGVRIDAGSNASDAALVINDHDASTSLFRVKGSGVVEFVDGTASLPSITNFGDLNTGIFFPAADTIAFAEGGAEAARFDSSQRVLIGTTTSRSTSGGERLVQIEGVTGVTSSMSITRNTNAATGPSITLAKTRGTAVGADTIVVDDDSLGAIVFSAADGTNADSRSAEIEVFVDGTPGENDTPGRLVFSTTADGAASSTERMRIDSYGNVIINNGGAGNEKTLSIEGTGTGTNPAATSDSGAALMLQNNYATDNAFSIIDFNNSNSLVTSRIAGVNSNISSRLGDIALLTHNGTGLTEAMRITSSQRMRLDQAGNLTVGTGNYPHTDKGIAYGDGTQRYGAAIYKVQR